FLEYDDERSGTFEPLRFVPKGKQVVLGLVTTKRGELEDKDVLKRRVEEASRYVPLDQLCLSPQCGFSSTVEGNLVTHEQQEAKLRLIVETAEEVWGCGSSDRRAGSSVPVPPGSFWRTSSISRASTRSSSRTEAASTSSSASAPGCSSRGPSSG